MVLGVGFVKQMKGTAKTAIMKKKNNFVKVRF
jgi:hypothetical protein